MINASTAGGMNRAVQEMGQFSDEEDTDVSGVVCTSFYYDASLSTVIHPA